MLTIFVGIPMIYYVFWDLDRMDQIRRGWAEARRQRAAAEAVEQAAEQAAAEQAAAEAAEEAAARAEEEAAAKASEPKIYPREVIDEGFCSQWIRVNLFLN